MSELNLEEYYPEDHWEWEEDWFWVKWLRRKGLLDYYDRENGTDKRGWVSKTWGRNMWRFLIPALHRLHKLKWQIAWAEDEIECGYKYLKGCEGSITLNFEDIEKEDLVRFLSDPEPGAYRNMYDPRISKVTDTTLTLSDDWGYCCPSCGWTAWDGGMDFYKAWNCRVENSYSGSSMDHMGPCHSWDEEWFCLRCWQIFGYSSGDC